MTNGFHVSWTNKLENGDCADKLFVRWWNKEDPKHQKVTEALEHNIRTAMVVVSGKQLTDEEFLFQVGAVKQGKQVRDAMVVFSAAVLVSTGKDQAAHGDHPQFAETPETILHKNLVVIKWKPKFTEKVPVRSYVVRWRKQGERIFQESGNLWGVSQYTTNLEPGTNYTLQVPSINTMCFCLSGSCCSVR